MQTPLDTKHSERVTMAKRPYASFMHNKVSIRSSSTTHCCDDVTVRQWWDITVAPKHLEHLSKEEVFPASVGSMFLSLSCLIANSVHCHVLICWWPCLISSKKWWKTNLLSPISFLCRLSSMVVNLNLPSPISSSMIKFLLPRNKGLDHTSCDIGGVWFDCRNDASKPTRYDPISSIHNCVGTIAYQAPILSFRHQGFEGQTWSKTIFISWNPRLKILLRWWWCWCTNGKYDTDGKFLQIWKQQW